MRILRGTKILDALTLSLSPPLFHLSHNKLLMQLFVCSSSPGHPFAAGLTLDRLSAFTVDDKGQETFLTGGALEQIQKVQILSRS